MLNLAPIDQREDLATKGYVDDAVGAVKAPYGLSVSSNLSSAGWYRVLKTGAGSGTYSAIVDIKITRSYTNSNNETHVVRLNKLYNKVEFAEESSVCNTQLIDKVRYTEDSSGGYVDIHYSGSSANTVTIDFTAATSPEQKNLIATEPFTGVSDSPSGETVLTTHDFIDNGSVFGALFADKINNAMGVDYFSMASGASRDVALPGNSGAVIFVGCMATSGNCICIARSSSAGVVNKAVFNPTGVPNLSVTFTNGTYSINIANSAGVYVFVLILRF